MANNRNLPRSWANARKVSSRIFVRKKGMSHVPLNGGAQQTPSASSERRKRVCSAASTRLHERLAFEKPKRSVPETWGRMYEVLALRN